LDENGLALNLSEQKPFATGKGKGGARSEKKIKKREEE